MIEKIENVGVLTADEIGCIENGIMTCKPCEKAIEEKLCEDLQEDVAVAVVPEENMHGAALIENERCFKPMEVLHEIKNKAKRVAKDALKALGYTFCCVFISLRQKRNDILRTVRI